MKTRITLGEIIDAIYGDLMSEFAIANQPSRTERAANENARSRACDPPRKQGCRPAKTV